MVHKKNYSPETNRFGAGLRRNIPFLSKNSRRKMAGNMGVRTARSRLVKGGQLDGRALAVKVNGRQNVGRFTHGRFFTWVVLAHVYLGGDQVYTWAV